MSRMSMLLPAFALLALTVAGSTASAAPVRHVPPAQVEVGGVLELVAEAPATTPTLVVHFRAAGTAAYQTVELQRRDEGHWIAVVPPGAVVAPGVEYFLTAGDDVVFASAAWPHLVPAVLDVESQRRARDEARNLGHRSRFHTAAEWVDYGSRRVGNTRVADRYYRIDGDFSYRLYAYPLEELRVGYTRLLGDTENDDPAMCPAGKDACTASAGFKVGGWFELGVGVVEGVRLDTRAMVMATQDGFGVGGRLELRLGVLDGDHIATGIEGISSVGTTGYFRLGWATVPKLPMSATVEVTNLPASYRDTGVRLFYDLAVPVAPTVRLGVRVGYAARTEQVGGFTGGGSAVVDF